MLLLPTDIYDISLTFELSSLFVAAEEVLFVTAPKIKLLESAPPPVLENATDGGGGGEAHNPAFICSIIHHVCEGVCVNVCIKHMFCAVLCTADYNPCCVMCCAASVTSKKEACIAEESILHHHRSSVTVILCSLKKIINDDDNADGLLLQCPPRMSRRGRDEYG